MVVVPTRSSLEPKKESLPGLAAVKISPKTSSLVCVPYSISAASGEVLRSVLELNQRSKDRGEFPTGRPVGDVFWAYWPLPENVGFTKLKAWPTSPVAKPAPF